MKVALVVPHFYPEFGGHEFYLASAMSKLGAEVHVLTSDLLPPRYFQHRKRAPKVSDQKRDGFELHRIRTYLDLHSMPTFDPREIIVRLKPDVVYTQEFYQVSSALAEMGSREAGVPLVFAQHMYEPPLGSWKVIWRGLTLTLGSRVIDSAARAVAISRAARSLLVSLGFSGEKISVVPLGVDTRLFTPSEDGGLAKARLGLEGPVLLYVGRLSKVKGVDALLRAFAQVLSARKNAKLLIVGTGELEGYLRELSNQLGLTGSVSFMGAWPHEGLPSLYDACDAFVLPSLREAFGLVGLEAMSMGKPVIGSRVGGIQDYVIPGRTGLLVNPGDVDSLRDAMLTLIDDETTRSTMGMNARQLATKEYGYDTVASRSLSTLQNAIHSRE